MHRYRSITRCLLVCAAALAATACALPSARENVDAAAQLVRSQSRASLEWRRNPEEDQAARVRAAALLDDGVSLDEAVAVAFLTHPGLQMELEKLAISRADLVSAMTPANPVAIVGSRKPGGDLAAFYPDRSVSIGVLQNVIDLLNIPDRTAVARHDLQRVRYETAQQAVIHTAAVVQAWLEYSAALQIHSLGERRVAAAMADVASSAALPASDERAAQNVAFANENRLRAEAELIRTELVAATTRGKLGELMGVTGWRDDWQVVVRLPPAPASDPDPVAIEAAAMQQRLDLLAAAKAVDARLRALATQRRFRWLNQLEVGVFREKALGGTAFTGPNAVVEIPLFNQRQAVLLKSDAELRIALRRLESLRLAARTEIRLHVAELAYFRQQLQQFEREFLLPARQQVAAEAGAGSDPAAPDRLRRRQASLLDEATWVGELREYWRARSALALSAGDWSAISGL
jgi:cobalt-zinc-cadmium efflux system outer membrane protein